MTDSRPDTRLTDKVIAIVAEVMQISPDSITKTSTFEELGIDSLGGLTIIGELEDTFHLQIPNEVALQINDIPQAVACLAEHMNPADTAPSPPPDNLSA